MAIRQPVAIRQTVQVPRSNRPRRPDRRVVAPPPELGSSLAGMQRIEEHRDGEWIVRSVSGGSSSKPYRCPGCQQEVSAGTPHIVAWPAQGVLGRQTTIEERRHWHTPCWRSRDRRPPR